MKRDGVLLSLVGHTHCASQAEARGGGAIRVRHLSRGQGEGGVLLQEDVHLLDHSRLVVTVVALVGFCQDLCVQRVVLLLVSCHF